MTAPARRKAIELPVELFIEDGGVPALGLTVNVSESGMLVVSETPTESGSEIRFRFTGFEGTALVVWAHPGEHGSMFLGMRFSELSDDAQAALDSLLRSAELEYRPGGIRPQLRLRPEEP